MNDVEVGSILVNLEELPLDRLSAPSDGSVLAQTLSRVATAGTQDGVIAAFNNFI